MPDEISEFEKLKRIPWNKGISPSDETKKKMSEAAKGRIPWNKGVPMSEETKLKLSESLSGQVPWNKGKVGAQEAWNKGMVGVSEETRAKMSAAKTGVKRKPYTEETRQKLSKANLGKILSDETKEKIGIAGRGRVPWNKGKECGPLSREHRRKIGESQSGENCHFWKGGITPENKKIRGSPEMAIWRNFVFERDDYQCQECLKWGGELRAHHCKSFADYPRLRFQTWNGLTLCKVCHQNYHGGIG